jgi:hypothetical protein
MRSVNLGTVINRCFYRIGEDPEQAQILDVEKVVDSINANIKRIWEQGNWPFAMALEEREFDEANPVIDINQADQEQIGEVIEVYDADPFTTSANPISFTLLDDLIYIDPRAASAGSCWVYFRKRAPQFTAVIYDSEKEYQLGELVYYKKSYEPDLDNPASVFIKGDTYKALVELSDFSPAASPESWERILFPEIFTEYVTARVAYEIKHTGEDPYASQELKLAEEALLHELDKLIAQQRQYRRGRARYRRGSL